jgi:hypothetical protein
MPFWLFLALMALAAYNLPLLCLGVIFVGLVQWDTERQRGDR